MKRKEIEVIVRAIIVHDKKILLARPRGEDYYFLPGGHVEFGESLGKTLGRELKEEVGATVKNSKFLGIVENRFLDGTRKVHELDLVYRATLHKYNVRTREAHLSFHWLSVSALKDKKILPVQMKKELPAWLRVR